MGQTNKEQFEARMKRFTDSVTLQGADRIPIIPNSIHYYPTRTAGISNKEATYNHEKRYLAWKQMVLEYDFDMAPGQGVIPGQWFEALGVNYYKWPGGGLGDNQPFQFDEQEFLMADEYDAFLADPADFTIRVIWPRKAKALESFGTLPPLQWFSLDPISLAAHMATPSFAATLAALQKLGEEFNYFLKVDIKYVAELEELGYPTLYRTWCHVPYDLVANNYRGMRGVMIDMFRNPDKLLAVMDSLTPMIIDNTIQAAKAVDNPRVPIWLHRGAAGFMSDEQYQKFYWPGLQAVTYGLLDAGLTPILVIRGDYTPRLHYLAELPRGKVPLQFDAVDRQQARQIIGGRQCFCSNVPASLLISGTPQDVKDDVKSLIDLFGDTGGLIIDGSAAIPDEAKPENVAAMVEATLEYGAS